MLRVAIAQINSCVGDLSGNSQKIADFIFQAREYKSDIIVFPELTVCGYPPEDLLYKKYFVRANIRIVKQLAKDVKDFVVVIGFVDLDNYGNRYNAAAILYQGKIRGIYHKERLPNYGVFDEKRYFVKGKDNPVFLIAGRLVGVNICEDIWEGNMLIQSSMSVSLLINLSASPYDVGKKAARDRLLKRRAREMKSFLCYANLVGGQDELVFDGGSLFVNPEGKIIAEAKVFEEDIIVADLDVYSDMKRKKGSSIVHICDHIDCSKRESILYRKEKALPRIASIYKALVLGTRDYIRKNGFKKAVIGLSGGIDSSLVTTIAVDAIGKDNVIGVSMPSIYTSQASVSDASQLASNLGIRLITISIERIFEAYLSAFTEEFAGLAADSTEENIQARIRGNILMALSNKFGWIVLTTGNKSEVAVGYCTLYGDMSGGFAVIKDVPKTMVYELARYVNDGCDKDIIPESVLKKPPTAELRENQKDQDTLPPYDILDGILKEYIERHKSLREIARDKDFDLVKRVISMVDRNEYKRRQAAPGVKITPRAFGKDWRLPITNKFREI